jgi:AcrR family transcriptional regulator
MAHPDVQDEQRLTPKGRATRDRIVRAAAELIVTEGLSASNMENVRRAASVSGSQLAHYFADKSALIRAVIRRQIGVVLDFHRQPKLRDLDSFEDFERWIDLNMRYLRRIGEVGRRDACHVGGRLLAVDRVARSSHPANERSRRSERERRPATLGVGHRQRSPRRRHVGLYLSGRMAAC